MTDEIGNLILERLRRMDDRLVNIESDMHDVKLRVSAVEDHIGTLVASMAGLNARMDRFDARLTRVERRLDISDLH
ncbi:hypothetical protein [uncultured Sphingomonas sp.]|uniref:hypothetical protein n=1 Tax=uncultured Sphingomonas sp. TaxID=158754 RepID=UPI002632278A|nr:hypothetical protein [uncultured Sphingomonas sp.]